MVLTNEQIQRITAPIAASYGIRSMSLFGSYARGEATEDSDVDLLIERGDALRGWDIGGLYVDLCDALGKELDLVTVAGADLDFLSRIRHDEVKLYEQPGSRDTPTHLKILSGNRNDGKPLWGFMGDPVYRNAISMPIQQIGELVKHLTEEFIDDHPDIPWKKIKGMRTWFAHQYLNMDRDIIWNVDGIPQLKYFCDRVLESEGSQKWDMAILSMSAWNGGAQKKQRFYASALYNLL